MHTFWSAGMTVLTALGAILLTVAGVAHAVRHREHRAVLRGHRLLPPSVAAPAAGAEVLVGAAMLAVLLTDPASTALPAAAQAGLYCAFAVYTAVLRTRRPGVPCGCFGAETVSWAVVCRAVTLAAGSAGCAVLGAPGPAPDRGVCVAAGVVLAMAHHLIPAWRGAGPRKSGDAFR
ncbi:MauE/DoxX family redox-associated membrane protein [Amycolatopsis kentuckyensis]|uniref:MauE/DoxX family redox-associated membrane protein n=1 Tax=Amycolatopsis kentuckyensis TaxID=218823 RepID=UPI000A360315|nr:MauE/DoxX family redox-associated membrane protein [Amycolatopsis kentuckyensis]